MLPQSTVLNFIRVLALFGAASEWKKRSGNEKYRASLVAWWIQVSRAGPTLQCRVEYLNALQYMWTLIMCGFSFGHSGLYWGRPSSPLFFCLGALDLGLMVYTAYVFGGVLDWYLVEEDGACKCA